MKLIWSFDLITNYADDGNCADIISLDCREESDTMGHCDKKHELCTKPSKHTLN